MAVSKRLRMEILRRDNHTCRYCGGKAPDVALTIDHVVPVTLGGQDVPENLVAACVDCNAGKASVPVGASVVADVSQDALRWANAIKEASRLRLEALTEDWRFFGEFFALWADRMYEWEGDENRWLPDDYEDSLQQLRATGLPDDEIRHAVEITARKRRRLSSDDYWRYFCGVCWRKVDKLQEMARSLLAIEEVD